MIDKIGYVVISATGTVGLSIFWKIIF